MLTITPNTVLLKSERTFLFKELGTIIQPISLPPDRMENFASLHPISIRDPRRLSVLWKIATVLHNNKHANFEFIFIFLFIFARSLGCCFRSECCCYTVENCLLDGTAAGVLLAFFYFWRYCNSK